MKTYHYTYTIIDEDTGQYYHGKHSTNDLNDGYMGSGSWIKSIQDKENIVKLINEFYESSDAAYKAEAELIGDLWKTDELCMNRMKGGKVSFFHEETYSKHCMEVWGVDHHMKSDEFKKTFRFGFREKEVQDKVHKTLTEKYGGRWSGSEIIKAKVESTNMQRYGETHTLNTESVKTAREDAIFEKYGTDNPFKNPEKLAEVMLERYGYSNAMHNPEIRAKHKQVMSEKDWTERNEKSKSTNIERYGVSVAANLPEVRERNKRSCPFNCRDGHRFDAGNFSNHMIKVHNWTKDEIRKYKDEN